MASRRRLASAARQQSTRVVTNGSSPALHPESCWPRHNKLGRSAPARVGEHGAVSPPAAGAPAPPAQRPYGCASCYFTGGHVTGRSIAGKLSRLPLALHLHGLALCHSHHPPDVVHPLAHHSYRAGGAGDRAARLSDRGQRAAQHAGKLAWAQQGSQQRRPAAQNKHTAPQQRVAGARQRRQRMTAAALTD